MSILTNLRTRLTPGAQRYSPDPEPAPESGRPTPDEADIVSFVMGRHEEAAERRRLYELKWARNTAFAEGEPWYGIGEGSRRTGRLEDIRRAEDKRAGYYMSVNHVDRLVRTAAANATAAQPDANPVPYSDTKFDHAAAEDGRAVLGYTDHTFRRQSQSFRAVYSCMVASVSWLKLYWDAGESADIVDPMTGAIQSAPAGNICEHLLPAFEVYLDPRAQAWEDVTYIQHVKVRSLSWIRERFGKAGERVTGDATERFGSTLEVYASAMIEGYATQTTAPGPKSAARVVEHWETPSAKYPQGRYIVVAGGKLLAYEERLPCGLRNSVPVPLPFVRLVYKEASGSPYGLAMVDDLVEPQETYNRIYSRMLHKAEQSKGFLAVPSTPGQGMSPMSPPTEGSREWERVPYLPGAALPQFVPAPPISSDWYELLGTVQAQMEDIAGVRPVSQGKVPTGTLSGVTVELLQQADNAQHAPFTRALEQFHVDRAEWEIHLFASNAAGGPPRMLGSDSSANPAAPTDPAQTPQAGGNALRGLSSGGQCRVYVTPGSATYKSAPAMNQQVMEMYGAGILGDPTMPETQILAVELMAFARSNRVVEKLRRDKEEQAIATQQQMAMQQKQMAAEQAMQQQQMAAQGDQAQAERDAKMQQIAMQQEADLQGRAMDEESAQLAHQREMEMAQAQAAMQGGMDAQKMAAQAHYSMALEKAKQRASGQPKR